MEAATRVTYILCDSPTSPNPDLVIDSLENDCFWMASGSTFSDVVDTIKQREGEGLQLSYCDRGRWVRIRDVTGELPHGDLFVRVVRPARASTSSPLPLPLPVRSPVDPVIRCYSPAQVLKTWEGHICRLESFSACFPAIRQMLALPSEDNAFDLFWTAKGKACMNACMDMAVEICVKEVHPFSPYYHGLDLLERILPLVVPDYSVEHAKVAVTKTATDNESMDLGYFGCAKDDVSFGASMAYKLVELIIEYKGLREAGRCADKLRGDKIVKGTVQVINRIGRALEVRRASRLLLPAGITSNAILIPMLVQVGARSEDNIMFVGPEFIIARERGGDPLLGAIDVQSAGFKELVFLAWFSTVAKAANVTTH